MDNLPLHHKSCVPCQSGEHSLETEAVEKLLKDLGGDWQINEKKHLYNLFRFKNFIEAITFANKIAELAEKEGHHPVLMIAWGQCSVEIWTHKINGLSENDFILAAKIEEIA